MKTFITLILTLSIGAGAMAQQDATSLIHENFTRLSKTYTEPSSPATLSLTMDFPDPEAPYAGELDRWIVSLCDKAFIPGYSFGGVPTDRAALGRFVAGKFFRFVRNETRHDSVIPHPYEYTLAMTVHTEATGFITYSLSSDLQLGSRNTMAGQQLVTYLYNSGDATNDVLFARNKFKAVKEALLQAAFTDHTFMQSNLVKGQNISKWQQLRPLFSPEGDNGWDGMLLPPAALTDNGVTFSFSPASIGPEGRIWYHFTLPYSSLLKYFSKKAEQAITESYPGIRSR